MTRPSVMKRVLLVVPLFLALFLVAPAPAAQACTCGMRSTVQQVEAADVVLRGTVVATADPDGSLSVRSSARRVTHEVAVAEVYKGAAAATTFVSSSAEGASCGIEVQEGREYVLFARRVGSELQAGLCGGTAPASAERVAEVENLTGPGRAPQGATTTAATPRGAARPGDSWSGLPLGVGLGGALVAAGLAGLWWRGRGSTGSPEA